MPYTFFHPGFVLPFARWFPRFLIVPALIIGSFVPDLDIIYRFSETRHHIFSYSSINILFELLPIGIIMTYYFYMIIFPIISYGEIDIHPKNYRNHLKKLPKIIVSILIAIGVHLFLDQYSHFNGVRTLTNDIGQNLGYEPSELENIYLLLLYLPQVIASSIGFILLGISTYLYRDEIRINTNYLRKNCLSFFTLSIIVISCFTTIKILMAGIEYGMKTDSIIIGVTCGLMSAFLLTPFLLWLIQKTKTKL